MTIQIVKDDDSGLVGCDENLVLYNGTRVSLGMDQLTITTTVADDGLSFDRSTGYKDSLISKGTTTRAGFDEARTPSMVASGLSGADLTAALDAAWEDEKALDNHSKVFIDAYVEGVLTTVEKKWTFIDWEPR